jgi:AraC-like DNA-binding protein
MNRSSAASGFCPTQPRIWRDTALSHVEARSVEDGRELSYGKHFHEDFSIGIVAGGQSLYLNGREKETIGAGTVVVMNPGDAHSCNPTRAAPWAYRMLYLNTGWLGSIQQELGASRNQDFQPFSTTSTRRPALYAAINRLYDVLTSSASPLEKEGACVGLAIQLQRTLARVDPSLRTLHPRLARAVDFIRANYRRAIRLDEICRASHLSASYLVRAFRQRFGMTPHAYLTNCRIEYCRAQLRVGRPIAEIAMAAGFSDQAHLQRTFKKLVAVTPGQFRGRRPTRRSAKGNFVQ